MQTSLVSKRVQVGNHYIDVRHADSKNNPEHVIFVHGIGVSGRYFVPLAEKFARTYNVHVIDMPGYGSTPKPKRPLSLVEMAEVINGYLDTAGIKQATIVGQSMGCQTVAHFAMKHPERCGKLILIAPTINKKERNGVMQAIRLLQDMFFETVRANVTILADYLRMGFVRYIITTCFMLDDQIEENLKQIHAKTLIIRGRNDPIVPKDWVSYLGSQAAHATTVQIPRAAHLVHFTRPADVLDVSEAFLNQ
jgi:pimeloyl-ACP methyl ester carboxylesterase